jgi:2-dehydro-3-deoxyphosphogluconate aldolase / (4S)-4-hydroxy-2-oxoglutarate aldolase
MAKEQIITRIRECGVVAVVRAESTEQAIKITDACIEGGVAAIEVTFTVPRAHNVIADLRKRYTDDQIILGAGTVLDPETARIAILEGASYIVAPSFNAETVRLCNRYRVACMPGCMTIREVVEAMEAGADIIKVFPGEAFGPGILKAIKGPIPHAELMPTGGVTVDNAAEWIKNGAVAVGVGGQLTAGAKTGDFKAITEASKKFIAAVKAARAK